MKYFFTIREGGTFYPAKRQEKSKQDVIDGCRKQNPALAIRAVLFDDYTIHDFVLEKLGENPNRQPVQTKKQVEAMFKDVP